MSSNESTIKCGNCRQDIIADKMFLHEGFCKRNNVFCEHCERVYLKKDYKDHIIEISDILSAKNRESISKKIKTNSENNNNDNKIINDNNNENNKKKENDNIDDNKTSNIKNDNKNSNDTKNKNNIKDNNQEINDNNNKIDNIQKVPEKVNDNSSINQERVNWIEQYTINTPIIISPNGEIISKKNKNEFLLPILGFEGVRNNNQNYLIDDNVYLNQDYFANVNNNNININNHLNYEQLNYINNGEQINNLYYPNDIGVQNVFRTIEYNGQKYNLNNQNNQYRNNNYNEKKIIKKKKKAKKNLVLNHNSNNIDNIDLSNIEFSSVTKINSSNNNNIIFPEEKKNNDNFNFIEKNIPNNKNLILNNNLNKYYSKNSINQESSIFINPIERTPQRINIYDTNTLNNTRKSFIISSKYKTTTEFNPIRVSKYRVKNINKNIIDNNSINNNFNNSPIRAKEPLDNTEKRNIRRKNFLFSPIEKINRIEEEPNIINVNDVNDSNNIVISKENSKTIEQSNIENINDSNDNEIINKNIIRNLKPTFNTINSETIHYRSNIMSNKAKSQDKNIIKKKSFQTVTNNNNNNNDKKINKKYNLTSKKIIKKKPKFIKDYLLEQSQKTNNNDDINQNNNMIKKMNSAQEINYKFANNTFDLKGKIYENNESQLNKTYENLKK